MTDTPHIPKRVYEKMLPLVTDVARSTDVRKPEAQDAIKRLCAMFWRMMHADTRHRFVEALDPVTLDFMPPMRKRTVGSDEELVHILQNWQQVMPELPEDQKGFALSIMANRNKPNWKPSEKQAVIIRSMWNERSIKDEGGSLVDGNE